MNERYQVQVHTDDHKGREWGGRPLGFEWIPAVRGTLNQTSDSDVGASTFDTFAQALVALRMCRHESKDERVFFRVHPVPAGT